MGKDLAQTKYCILFCNGSSCKRNGAEELTREIRAYIRMEGLFREVHTIKTLCMGHCKEGPYVCVLPDNVWYKEMSLEKGIELVEKHIKKEQLLDDYILYAPRMKAMNTKLSEQMVKPRHFTLKKDKELGEILIASADAWEMNLYPMLKAIFEKYHGNKIQVPEIPDANGVYPQSSVTYDGVIATIHLPEVILKLVVGILAKDADPMLHNERITHVEVFSTQAEVPKRGIRLLNKRGDTKLLVWDKSSQQLLWKHFVNIYMDTDPETILNTYPVENE